MSLEQFLVQVAEQTAEQAIPLTQLLDPATMPELLRPLAKELQKAIAIVSWLVGGFFGLYLIYVIGMIFERIRLNKILKRIEAELFLVRYTLGIKDDAEEIFDKQHKLEGKLRKAREKRERKQ